MNSEAWVGLSITIVIYMTMNFFKSKAAAKGPHFHAPPVGYHAPSRIFLGWVIMLTVFNLTGYATMVGMRVVADHNANALWVMGLSIGWLGFNTFIVMPSVLPADYRRRQQTKPNVGTILLAFCCLGWVLAQFGSILSWLTSIS